MTVAKLSPKKNQQMQPTVRQCLEHKLPLIPPQTVDITGEYTTVPSDPRVDIFEVKEWPNFAEDVNQYINSLTDEEMNRTVARIDF